MSIRERLASAAERVAALTSITRVRAEDSVRDENRRDGGDARTTNSLEETIKRLESAIT